MSNYEPPAESVEVLAKELHEAYRRSTGCEAFECSGNGWRVAMREQARFVLRRQHEREQPLRVAMDRARLDLRTGRVTFMDISLGLELALAAHAKLDAPKDDPIVNLRGAVDQIERECPGRVIATLKDSQAWQVIQIAARGKAAVEREEKR